MSLESFILTHSIYLHFSISAGVGRTGTFITLDAMMERLKERDDLNIFEFVSEMRTRRKQMVQTIVSALLFREFASIRIACYKCMLTMVIIVN